MTAPGATLLPHPPIVWEHVRVVDILFLLSLGVATEVLFRTIILAIKRKPNSLTKKEDIFFKLEYDTDKLRKKGPSAFVETSKSERQLLAMDKELKELYENRQTQRETMEKYFKYTRHALSLVIFLIYFGVPVISFSSGKLDGDILGKKESIVVPFLFPLSVAEFGYKMSKWGLGEALAFGDALSGLVVMWAGSSFVGQIMEGVESLVLSS